MKPTREWFDRIWLLQRMYCIYFYANFSRVAELLNGNRPEHLSKLFLALIRNRKAVDELIVPLTILSMVDTTVQKYVSS